MIALAVSICLACAPLGAQMDLPGAVGSWNQQGIIYLDHSLNARMHPVPVQAVRMGEGFWTARRKVVTERALPAMLAALEEHGVVDNFRRLAGKQEVPRKGPAFSDADLYKWIEAAAWALASNETSDSDKQKLRGDIDSLTNTILAAQDASGYLDTYFVADRAHLRLTDPVHSHEDYCLGQLLQAGIAYYRATGNRRLLDAGIRFADYLLANFGPSKRPFVSGHPALEMALVELFRTTAQTKYLDFTRYLYSGVEKDRMKLKDSDMRYTFSGRPFTSRTELEGHAARAIYATSGATDFFTETGEPAYKRTLDLLWTDLTARKMYITGSIGSRSSGESFGDDYELPSEQAPAETCPAIVAAGANVMWNFRMLTLTGDSRYADVLERALYNGVNSGVLLSGNPTCPPNLERLFESLPGYFYATSRDGIYVSFYHESKVSWHLEDGTPFVLSQSTGYPWNGDVKIVVQPAKPVMFTVNLRWPGWAAAADISVNGQVVAQAGKRGAFIAISRTWNPGDVITLSLPMAVMPMAANPRVADDYGRIAVQRGPLVYALEQPDQTGVALGDLFFRGGTVPVPEMRRDLLGGITVLKVSGLAAEKSLVDEPLYQPVSSAAARAKRSFPLTFIPYYAVGNRDQAGIPAAMEVWVPVTRSEGTDAASFAPVAYDRLSNHKAAPHVQ